MCLSKMSRLGKTFPQLQVICCWPARSLVRPEPLPNRREGPSLTTDAVTALAADDWGAGIEAIIGGGGGRGINNDDDDGPLVPVN